MFQTLEPDRSTARSPSLVSLLLTRDHCSAQWTQLFHLHAVIYGVPGSTYLMMLWEAFSKDVHRASHCDATDVRSRPPGHVFAVGHELRLTTTCRIAPPFWRLNNLEIEWDHFYWSRRVQSYFCPSRQSVSSVVKLPGTAVLKNHELANFGENGRAGRVLNPSVCAISRKACVYRGGKSKTPMSTACHSWKLKAMIKKNQC